MSEENEIKNLILPEKHVLIKKVRAPLTLLFGGRGTFKTTRAMPLFVADMVYSMPRSSGMLCGISYEDMGNNTINPLLGGLAEMGIHEGDRYVIGRKPPAHWATPYMGILNGEYKRVMSWHNGTAMHLVSMEKKAPANGLSVQWGAFDEVKFQEERKLIDKIFPTFRGNEKHFAHLSTYLSKFFCTDKEADPARIKWLLDKRKLVDHELVNIVISYQDELDKWLALCNHPDATKKFKQEALKEIEALQEELNELRKGLVYVSEINIDDVRHLQSKEWYDDKVRNTTPSLWKVVYKNEDPEVAGETFYPYFSKEVHAYESNDDVNTAKPFIIAPDYQHSVAPIPVCQLSKLPGKENFSLNYIDEVYTLPEPIERDILPNGNGGKGGLAEAVQLFCLRYKNHHNRNVYYIYDHTATGRRVDAEKYYKIVSNILKKNKWRVIKVYTGKAPEHYLKYIRTSEWLKHEDAALPAIFINKGRCVKLMISIANAAAKSTNGKTEKNKEYENTVRFPNLDQSETTHFSDCFDMVNHAVLFLKKIKTALRTGIGFRSSN